MSLSSLKNDCSTATLKCRRDRRQHFSAKRETHRPTSSLITIVHAVPHIHHARRDFHKSDKIGRALQHLTYTIASHPTSPSQPKCKRLCLGIQRILPVFAHQHFTIAVGDSSVVIVRAGVVDEWGSRTLDPCGRPRLKPRNPPSSLMTDQIIYLIVRRERRFQVTNTWRLR